MGRVTLQMLVFILAAMLLPACATHEVVIGTRGESSPSIARDAATHAAVSDGCGIEHSGPNELPWQGATVRYLVDLPADYDNSRPYPLIVAFRGSPENAERFRANLSLAAEAGAAAILVHPETAKGAPFWRVPDDVPLFDALVTHLLQRYCVDPGQIFALGYAQGGWLVSAFACESGSRLKGAALFAGTAAEAPCQAPVAMLIAQGDADMIYSVKDGRETRDSWVAVNGCDATQTSSLRDPPCVEYTSCQPGAPVRYCEFAGGHELPSFAAEASWRFFSMLL